uniref:DNA helicase n=1 Tax=Lygus hesperus TaxID=30085 RepID=A0A0A9WTM6_LYGHE
MICADDCSYINTQTLKLQESPEDVPTGEIPRHVSLLAENYLVGQVKPGTRVTIIGVHATFSPKYASALEQNLRSVNDIGVRVPYLRVFGIQQDSEANDILLGKLTPNDEEKILQLVSNTSNMYELISRSMAPAIMGHDDIKKAITCCLFGGCSKVLADGIRLRGDINILLIGDPSVAKSQFLKFAAQVAPISVYTSGKGSSAAGLTAAVIRDASTGDFHLEGGALVLADRGVVCIDEFDKMREQDRVAIHEAMEQQTISIAKAGITTILNSRTSVIAAANPTFGRYDDMKSATDNIDFQATILSRFDLIFIVRDLQDTTKDQALAEHIINVHRRTDTSIQMYENVLDTDTIRKLIAYVV